MSGWFRDDPPLTASPCSPRPRPDTVQVPFRRRQDSPRLRTGARGDIVFSMASVQFSFTQRRRHLAGAAGRVAMVAGTIAAALAVPRLLPEPA
jgi:hypothetical protein